MQAFFLRVGSAVSGAMVSEIYVSFSFVVCCTYIVNLSLKIGYKEM